MVSDRHEEAGDVDFGFRAFVVAQQGARYAGFIAQHFGRVVLEEDFDVRGVHHPLLHGFRSPQVGLADDQIYLAADRSQVGGLLACRIAASDDRYVLLAVEESVAGGAGADAHALEFLFGGQSQVFGCGAGRNDQGFGLDLLLSVHDDVERARGEIDAGNDARADIRPEAQGLLAHVIHEFGAVDAFGETGEVFDFGGGGELSARFDPFVEYRREIRPGGIDRSRIARRAAADDQTFYVFHKVFFLLSY